MGTSDLKVQQLGQGDQYPPQYLNKSNGNHPDVVPVVCHTPVDPGTCPTCGGRRPRTSTEVLRAITGWLFVYLARVSTDPNLLADLFTITRLVNGAVDDAVRRCLAAGMDWDLVGTAAGTSAEEAQERWGSG